jgi:hypothetical protein
MTASVVNLNTLTPSRASLIWLVWVQVYIDFRSAVWVQVAML